MVLSAGAQSVSPQTGSPTVTIHQRVNQSCELMQPAALKDNGKYASLVIPGTAAEIYSSELAKGDFLAIDLLAKRALTAGIPRWYL